ncbi:NAD(P)/FAD-dependent oxidoreductase [Mycolicibacterium sp. HK-90]|uniref:flavin-containing monooxygenase n=1 Tax=Mycolicibacterium sp. HK-90 TaxID=3056937 RepID=UPI00265ADD29|nr:NAD(P)/FAD-dependent oxidoreductase [Mycolicibacterium sp. HK-90]WKG05497.1 NAD(P)/FAD-dependent oxidoreductase [Mycolicibacterium sp. HK-90]
MSVSATLPDSYDVVIIGAGISGIGAATYLTREFPKKKIVLLEGRTAIGGTWDLFRYPGIRSDSDLHTFAYEFKSWRHQNAIADAPLILDYLKETVDEFGLGDVIRYRHNVIAAAWSSDDAEWVLTVEVTDCEGGVRTEVIKAGWVYAGTGYYRYDEAYTPEFDGRDDFDGDIIHPQFWPEGYDHSGKNVVVIGSGATAITLIPSMLKGDNAAHHVTMLQRTPTYIMSMPRIDAVSLKLTRLLGERRGYLATRWKNVLIDWAVVELMTRFPKTARRLIRHLNTKALPAGFDVDRHFNPPYDPWDQRLCLAPDGDFFASIREGRASVVTDRISRFTKNGIELETGEELPADLIVTATGLNTRLFGGIDLTVDGRPVDLSSSVVYRGCLLSGVPNWMMAIGYTKSSWTLKISLLGKSLVELIRYMDTHGYDTVAPHATDGVGTRSVLDLDAGYMQRAKDSLPRQGDAMPWLMKNVFLEDRKMYRGSVIDDNLRFSSRLQRELEDGSAEMSRAASGRVAS